MKRFYATIFTLLTVISGAYSQQADRVLVDGNPPLTQSTVNNLIDFFEFGLAAKFNTQERVKFQAQRIADWQNPDPKNKEALLSILDTRANLIQMDDAKLREMQGTIQKFLLDNFANQPNDPTAQLLMEVYNNGHSALSAISSAPVPQPNYGGGGDVSALLGTWGTGTVSSVNYTSSMGSSTNGGGTQVQYTFKPGNHYEFAALTTSALYSCSMKALTYKSGIVQFNGDTLTFIPQHATFTSQDSCSASGNYQKPASTDRETFYWSIQQDQYGTKLCLRNAAINGCAYKR